MDLACAEENIVPAPADSAFVEEVAAPMRRRIYGRCLERHPRLRTDSTPRSDSRLRQFFLLLIAANTVTMAWDFLTREEGSEERP